MPKLIGKRKTIIAVIKHGKKIGKNPNENVFVSKVSIKSNARSRSRLFAEKIFPKTISGIEILDIANTLNQLND